MQLDEAIERAASMDGGVVVLTGAGISAESGIPTFRGAGGYWTVGSRNYQPEEMATREMFGRHPEAVWGWYLHRRGICRAAQPNAAHRAVVELEARLATRCVLVTQNVDGLHLAAGSDAGRTLQVHGNLHFMRCSRRCVALQLEIPESFGPRPGGEPVSKPERDALTCAGCGGWMRPHVLWFDETYDEPNYRYETALRAASQASLFLVVGTSGATSLPIRMAGVAARRGAVLVDVDPQTNPFSSLAEATGGLHVRARAADAIPDLVARCIASFAGRGRAGTHRTPGELYE